MTSGLLLLLALHLLSAGVTPGSRAEKPSLALLWILRPVQNIEANFADDTTGFFHDYFDLVKVRQENLRLREQVAALEGQRTRLAELEVENRHLSDLLELRDALAMGAVAARGSRSETATNWPRSRNRPRMLTSTFQRLTNGRSTG